MPYIPPKYWLVMVNIILFTFMIFLLFLNDQMREELFYKSQEPGLAAVATLFIYVGGLISSVYLVTKVNLPGTNRSLLIIFYFILAKTIYGKITDIIAGDPISLITLTSLFLVIIIVNRVNFD